MHSRSSSPSGDSSPRPRAGAFRRRSATLLVALLGLVGLTSELRAQNVISVPFGNGFVGTRGSSAGSANNVLTYATLGIDRTFFIQSSSTNQFELQGNDIPGTLRIVRTNGTTIDIPASANWRMNTGSTTDLVGILPRPTSPITYTYAGGSIQITDGSNPGGSSIGGYVAGYAGTVAHDGDSPSGNAAQSQVLSGLNAYLSTVVASRPAGPVTVTTLTTTNTTPTIGGTATLAAGENLSVVVSGVQYATSSTPAVVRSGNTWSLALATPLAVGTYSVTATIANANGFTLSDATSSELVIASAGGTVTLGGSFTANAKTYDGITSATGTTSGLTLVGVTAPDQVTIAGVTLAFQSAAAGTGKTVVVTGVTLGGANSAQYSVNLSGAPTASASITPKALTISGVSATNRTYDGTTTATLAGTATYAGLASGESFTVTGTPAASFATADIGAGKSVTVTGYTAPSANYTVTQPTGLTANVTARALTIGGSFTAANKVYDGTFTATIATNALTLVGLVSGESLALVNVSARFSDAAVGAGKTVSLAGATFVGAAGGNYTMTIAGAPTTTADITPAVATLTLAGSFTASHKTYDATTVATGNTSGLTLVGVTVPDQVTIASVTLRFQNSAVGTAKTVAITAVTLGGANAAGYAVSLADAPTATASITPRLLTIGGTFTASNKVYDGTTAATIATNALTLSGVAICDDVTLTSVAATFADAAAGTGKLVSLGSAILAGSAASNYTVNLAGAPTTTADITSAGSTGGTLTLGGSLTANDRTYDGTTTATGSTSGLTLVGVTAPDQVTIAGQTLGFQSSAVGNGKTVVVTGVTLGGASASHYTVDLAGAPTTTASIRARPLTIAGTFSAADKLFDGTTSATITANTLRLVGAINGDDVALASTTAAFGDPLADVAKPVTLVGARLTGAAAGNYALALAGAPTTTATIIAAAPPSAPRTHAATPGDGSLTVSWTIPATEGCRAISGYVVEYSANDGRTWSRLSVAASPAVLGGLTNNVAHQVRVAAVNPCGTGPAAATGPVVPIAPTRDALGRPPASAPGTASITTGGVRLPVTTEIVQDTVARLAGDGFTLQLRALDQPGAPIPIDSSRTLQLEQGGRTTADGTGFAPGTFVTLYLFPASGEPSLLGTVAVAPDGSFTGTVPIAESLPEGTYTLQVNGVDRTAHLRSVSLGVEVAPPPPDLDLAAAPDRSSPAVGDTITITLTVTNHGRGAATDVVIPRAFKEPGFTIVRTTPLDGTYDAPTQEWRIARIAPAAQARMLLTVLVLPPAASQGTKP